MIKPKRSASESSFNSFTKSFNTVLGLIAAILILLLIGLVVFEVVSRNFFGFSTLASEEISGLTLVSITYLGLGYCFIKGGHIVADFLYLRFSAKVQRGLDIFNAIIGLLFCACITYFGIELFWQYLEFNIRSASRLRIPMTMPSVTIPIGAIGTGLAILSYTIRLIRNPSLEGKTYFTSDDSKAEKEIAGK